MKKTLSSIFGLLFIFQCESIISYADECFYPYTLPNELNLSQVQEGAGWDTQYLTGKKVELMRYEKMSSLKDNLWDRVKKSSEDVVRAWNSRVSADAVIDGSVFLVKLFSAKVGINVDFVLEAFNSLKKLFTKQKESLSDDEITVKIKDMEKDLIEAQNQGKFTSAMSNTKNILEAGGAAAVTAAALKGVDGVTKWLVLEASKAVAESGILAKAGAVGKIAGTVGKGVAFVSRAVAPIAIVGATFGVGLFVYNRLCDNYNKNVMEETLTAQNDFTRNMKLYNAVEGAIKRHEWIDKNLLIMSTSTIPNCDEVDVTFHNIPKIEYTDMNKIYRSVQSVKCQFLGEDTRSCRQDVLEEIKCILNGGDDCIK